jgi:hypothetical protein
MLTHSPRAFPWEIKPPVGTCQGTRKHRADARGRHPRQRKCLRKGCRRKYKPRRWNQRYCQDPECQREIRRWQAAKRQAKRRQADKVKAQHAEAERARRQLTKSASQAGLKPEVAPARGHAAKLFLAPLCDRPGCHNPRVISVRNPARYCCPACRRAVRIVLDRERKWRSRGTLDGRKKRAYEYQNALPRRSPRQRNTSALAPSRSPPE